VSTVEVRVVNEHAGALLVERVDERGVRHRRLLPAHLVVDGRVSERDWDQGLPMSEDWAAALEITVTPEKADAALKEAGIWTLADWERRPDLAEAVLRRLIMRDFVKAIEKLKGG
jgi:hypothetical protein